MNLEQYIPEAIGFVTGAATGGGFDYLATRIADINSQPLVTEWGIQSYKKRNFIGNVKRLKPIIPLALGIAGIFGVEAATNHQTNIVTPAAMEVVIDHSGATRFPYEGQAPTLPEINQIVSNLNSDKQVVGNAFVGAGDSITQMSLSDALTEPTTQVVGDSALNTGLNEALENAITSRADKKTSKEAVVVITNGNAIGNPSSFVTSLKKQDKTPVYVVNVEEPQTTTPSSLKEFAQIANITGGNHWNADSQNLTAITRDIEKTLKPEVTPVESTANLGLYYVGIAGLLLIAEETFRLRSRNVLQNNAKGE